jgi:hypothetical protein
VLVEKLDTDGALSKAALATTRRLGWFELPLEPPEVDQLVASAFAHGIAEPLTEPGSAQQGVETRWLPTERGRQLPFPRGASVLDYGIFAVNIVGNVRRLFTDWWAIALAALAAGGIGIANKDQLLAAAAAFVFVALVILQGMRAERDLKAAAEAWPRLKAERPARWKWQTLSGRAELVAASQLSVMALLAAAWAIDSESAWQRWTLIAALVVTAFALIAYYVRLVPLRRAWKREASG